MLSITCKTALKAVIFVAAKYESGENAGIKEIAEHIGASEHTIGKVMQLLVKQGVINSIKGPSGGFFITAAQKRQPLIHIIEAVDGKDVFKGCGLGLSRCSATHPCPIHHEYKVVRDGLQKLFTEKKLADLCEPVANGFAYLLG